MYNFRARENLYCRWCGNEYKSKKPQVRDGFCCNACKMAHQRAYKKYVTQRRARGKESCSCGNKHR